MSLKNNPKDIKADRARAIMAEAIDYRKGRVIKDICHDIVYTAEAGQNYIYLDEITEDGYEKLCDFDDSHLETLRANGFTITKEYVKEWFWPMFTIIPRRVKGILHKVSW